MDPFYIDTGVTGTIFQYPHEIRGSDVDAHEAYKVWLLGQYQKTIATPDGVVGVAQHITSMIYRQKEYDTSIIAIGPFARAAAETIKSISGNQLSIDLPQE